jgi:hypothetical protein
VQQYCHDGTFPARRASRYGNLTSFMIKFLTLGTPTQEVRMSSDESWTVAELKVLIKASIREWYEESFLLNAAMSEVEDWPNVGYAESINFSTEHDDEWRE